MGTPRRARLREGRGRPTRVAARATMAPPLPTEATRVVVCPGGFGLTRGESIVHPRVVVARGRARAVPLEVGGRCSPAAGRAAHWRSMSKH